jgi:hypothetical protein
MVVERPKRPRVDPYYEGEPHPLPKTRAWVAEYRRYGTEPKPPDLGATDDRNYEEWVQDNPPPDLQALVARAGGYQNITPEAWAEFDQAKVKWEARRCVRLGRRG